MENMTEVMTNDVTEVMEETVKSSGSGFGKAAIGVGVLAGLGFGAYKLIKKLRAKKNAGDTVVESTAEYVEVEDCDEDDE